MNWKKVLNWIFGILLLVSLFFNCLQFYQMRHQNPPDDIEIHQKDTILITKHDTCWKDTTIYKTKYDTLIFYKRDSTNEDTIKIEIPIEHKKYSFKTEKDSMKIEGDIYYHGYKAEIDTTDIRYEYNFTQKLPKQRKIGLVWNAGIYAGYGIGFNNGQYYFSPEVGIGFSIGIGGLIK